MLASMKTTIHHVAACDACESRVGASAVAAPVLDMITARSVRDRSENSPAPLGRVLGAIAN